MGLLIGLAVAALTLAALWRVASVGRAGLQLAGAALLFGLGGYALQGKPGLRGSPAADRPVAALPPVIPIEIASEFYGRFNAAYFWLVIANGYAERGDSAGAVAILRSGLRAQPRDSELWIALGNALILHGGGRPSPASELAFARASRLAPLHPGPPFLYGLTLLGQGQPERALDLWRQAATRGPAAASWQPNLRARIATIERLIGQKQD